MTSFSIGVVAHVYRQAEADVLVHRVGADYISVDTGLTGAGANHRQVLRTVANLGNEWSVMLEDDADPVEGFREQLAMALAAAPSPVVSLYLGRLRPPQFQARISKALNSADEKAAHWIEADHLIHAVGVAIRTDLVHTMCAEMSLRMPIDQAIGKWASVNGHKVSYSVPSLVDHSDLPTLIRHVDGRPRVAGRVAWRVGTRPAWNREAVAL